ncbi:MAG TPA: hypothetical protein VMG08_04060 [Allosphingosinicella sp.]|nr:hypothetical protein [Allosphingosinicella sp.]
MAENCGASGVKPAVTDSDKVKDSHKRLHNLVYSVIYPAILGSFIFGLLSQSVILNWGWGVVLAVYFTLQQIEGDLSGERYYGLWAVAQDIGEIAVMVLAFVSLGLTMATVPDLQAAGAASPVPSLPVWLFVPLAFLYPVIVRVLSLRSAHGEVVKSARDFYFSLTFLSVFATLISFLLLRSWLGVALVGAVLGFYLVVFQIWNDWWATNVLPAGFQRPTQEQIFASREEYAATKQRKADAKRRKAEAKPQKGAERADPDDAPKPVGAAAPAHEETVPAELSPLAKSTTPVKDATAKVSPEGETTKKARRGRRDSNKTT